MARNLFILSALTLLAGCSTPELPPSSSGAETLAPIPAAPVGTATGTTTAPTTPSGVPAKKKLPLGTVRQK